MFKEETTDDPHAGQPVRAAGTPLADATGAMVLVHGRGATAESILPLGPDLTRDRMAFLAPQAATGTWYPNPFLAPIRDNEPWLSSALRALEGVLTDIEAAGLDPSSVVIRGLLAGRLPRHRIRRAPPHPLSRAARVHRRRDRPSRDGFRVQW